VKDQINGVSTTINELTPYLNERFDEVKVISPSLFKVYKPYLYPEVSLAYGITNSKLAEIIGPTKSTCIHIFTEGPIGLKVRNYCVRNKLKFTTSYLTHFAEQLKNITYLPEWLTYAYLRWFHRDSNKIIVATNTIRDHLKSKGFKNKIEPCSKGVNTTVFHPYKRDNTTKPLIAYVGRVSKEKNIEAFLDCKFDCDKVVIGDGPYRKTLQSNYPNIKFVGYLKGKDLAKAYSDADATVFPSLTDTFGLTIIESLACGTPVAAFPVTGPKDILTPETGGLDWDIDVAISKALNSNSQDCIELAAKYSWSACANCFVRNLIITKNG